MARDYTYDTKYNARPEQKRRRAARARARYHMIKRGVARKGDGRDVHHVDGNPHNNKRSNLRMVLPSTNRSRK